MKQTFLILFLFISNFVFGQTEFCIHLKSNVEIKNVSVSGINLPKSYDAEFKNGFAIVKIPAKSSDQYSIKVGNKKIDGWFNSGKIDIYLELKDDKFSVTKTKNTPVYQQQVNYFKAYREYLNDKSIGTKFIKKAILDSDQDTFILVPLNHYLKLLQNDKEALQFVGQTLNNQPKTTKEHIIYLLIENRLKKLTEIKEIDIKRYSVINIKGQSTVINFASNKKYKVLDFWFTSCPPCIKDHNKILENPEMFTDLNAELIGISTDIKQEKWLYYLDKKNINWENYRIENDKLEKDLGIWSFPTYIILDQENNIVGNYSNIIDTIEALK